MKPKPARKVQKTPPREALAEVRARFDSWLDGLRGLPSIGGFDAATFHGAPAIQADLDRAQAALDAGIELQALYYIRRADDRLALADLGMAAGGGAVAKVVKDAERARRARAGQSAGGLKSAAAKRTDKPTSKQQRILRLARGMKLDGTYSADAVAEAAGCTAKHVRKTLKQFPI